MLEVVLHNRRNRDQRAPFLAERLVLTSLEGEPVKARDHEELLILDEYLGVSISESLESEAFPSLGDPLQLATSFFVPWPFMFVTLAEAVPEVNADTSPQCFIKRIHEPPRHHGPPRFPERAPALQMSQVWNRRFQRQFCSPCSRGERVSFPEVADLPIVGGDGLM